MVYYDRKKMEGGGFDYLMCCGFPIHVDCLKTMGTSNQTNKIPGA